MMARTTFESQPAVSRADTSCTVDITWKTKVTASCDGPSVFESAPQARATSVTYADEVRPEQSDVSVFESQPAPMAEYTTDDYAEEWRAFFS